MLVQGPILQSDPIISPPLISSPSRVPTPPHDSPSQEIKLTYGVAYSKLIMKVKKLEKKVKSRKARRRVRLIVLEDEDISTTNVPVTTAGAKISTASPEDKTAKTFDDSDDITLAEILIEIKRSATKPQKVKGVSFRDVEETPRLIRSTTTLQPLPSIDPKDNARIDADHELAARLTYEEQEQFTIEERAKLLAEFFEKRKKQLAVQRADGSYKNYKIFSEMLDDFDRQDVIDLHRLVQERYDTTGPEGYDLLLWGDLKILFEPNEEDEIWKNQQDYNLISWRLFDSCGVHILLMNTRISIHMLIEKTYPFTQDMLLRILNRRLEVDHESEMAFELLRFTRSQLKE
nr:hypothetical protein [Tanacetum cinerariifolium]